MFSRTRKRASPTLVTKRSTKSIKTFAFSNALPRTTTWLQQWIVIMPVVGTERGDRGGCGGKPRPTLTPACEAVWTPKRFKDPTNAQKVGEGALQPRILRPAGVEPTTFSSGGERSIQLSYGRGKCR